MTKLSVTFVVFSLLFIQDGPLWQSGQMVQASPISQFGHNDNELLKSKGRSKQEGEPGMYESDDAYYFSEGAPEGQEEPQVKQDPPKVFDRSAQRSLNHEPAIVQSRSSSTTTIMAIIGFCFLALLLLAGVVALVKFIRKTMFPPSSPDKPSRSDAEKGQAEAAGLKKTKTSNQSPKKETKKSEASEFLSEFTHPITQTESEMTNGSDDESSSMMDSSTTSFTSTEPMTEQMAVPAQPQPQPQAEQVQSDKSAPSKDDETIYVSRSSVAKIDKNGVQISSLTEKMKPSAPSAVPDKPQTAMPPKEPSPPVSLHLDRSTSKTLSLSTRFQSDKLCGSKDFPSIKTNFALPESQADEAESKLLLNELIDQLPITINKEQKCIDGHGMKKQTQAKTFERQKEKEGDRTDFGTVMLGLKSTVIFGSNAKTSIPQQTVNSQTVQEVSQQHPRSIPLVSRTSSLDSLMGFSEDNIFGGGNSDEENETEVVFVKTHQPKNVTFASQLNVRYFEKRN